MIIYYTQDGKTFVGELMIKAATDKKVKKPGSRGGQYYIDKQGVVRYGARPLSKKGKGDSKKQMGLFSPDTELTAKRSGSDYLGMKPEKKVDKNKPRKQMDLFSGKQAEKPKEIKPKMNYADLVQKLDNADTLEGIEQLNNEIENDYDSFKENLSFEEKQKFNDAFDSKKTNIKDNKEKKENPVGYLNKKLSTLQHNKMRADAILSSGPNEYFEAARKEASEKSKKYAAEIKEIEKEIKSAKAEKPKEPPKSTPIQDMAAKVNKPAEKEPWEMTLEEARKSGAVKETRNAEIQISYKKTKPIDGQIFYETKDISKEDLNFYPDRSVLLDKQTNNFYKINKNEITKLDKTERQYHKQVVKQALSEGKPVPAEVLADYPDLKKPASPKPETPIKDMAEKVGAVKNSKKKDLKPVKNYLLKKNMPFTDK